MKIVKIMSELSLAESYFQSPAEMDEFDSVGGVAPAGRIEDFVNNKLRADLKRYEEFLTRNNAEVMEYMELQKFCENLGQYLSDGFKTQVNVGGNFFMQAKVDQTDSILVNVGLNHYIDFTPAEAIKFCKMKIGVLEKEADVIREKSIDTRAHIKLALLCLSDRS